VACSRKGFENNCPKTCRHAQTHMCGNGCSGLLAQQLPGAKHSSCWSVGQWGAGKKVSVSLLDPTDPQQGVVYTMLQGDSKGCPVNTARTLSLAVRCPGVGMPVRRPPTARMRCALMRSQAVPVMNVSSLGNCAYVRFPPLCTLCACQLTCAPRQAANMMHPAACPITEGSQSASRARPRAPKALTAGPAVRRDERLSYFHNTAADTSGGAAETMGHVALSLLALLGLYLLAGSVYRYSELGARGADVIPGLPAWSTLPAQAGSLVDSATAELRAMLEPGEAVIFAKDVSDEPSSASEPLLKSRLHAF
jgi:hypothetical protein